MGFSMSQAQWLVQFMRNLPGGAPQTPSQDEYTEAMLAQREQAAQAQAQQAYEESYPNSFEHTYPGYEAPPFGYWDDNPPEY